MVVSWWKRMVVSLVAIILIQIYLPLLQLIDTEEWTGTKGKMGETDRHEFVMSTRILVSVSRGPAPNTRIRVLRVLAGEQKIRIRVIRQRRKTRTNL